MQIKITHQPVQTSENSFPRDIIKTPLPALNGEGIPQFPQQNQPSIKDASSLTWKGMLLYTISEFQSDKFINIGFMTQSVVKFPNMSK